jgi:dienelactone hydrolase
MRATGRTLSIAATLLSCAAAIPTICPNGRGGVAQAPPPNGRLLVHQSQPIEQPNSALAGTSQLSLPLPSDLLDRQRQQISRYFLDQIAATPPKRDRRWQPCLKSAQAYRSCVSGHRDHLRAMLGMIPTKPGRARQEVLEAGKTIGIEDVTIPIAHGFDARTFLFLPSDLNRKPAVIAIPPANQSAAQFAGIAEGTTPAGWLTALLERDVAVAIPEIVERIADHPLCDAAGGKDRRHILWRGGFIVGRTLVGIDVQQVVAVRGFLAPLPGIDPRRIGVLGQEQGGMTALYAAALEPQFAGAAVLDYFQEREASWKEPIDRTIYGQLNEFGDAELAGLIAPRPLFIGSSPGATATGEGIESEFRRADRFYQVLGTHTLMALPPTDDAMRLAALRLAAALQAVRTVKSASIAQLSRRQIDERRDRHFEGLYKYVRSLDATSDQVRTEYWKLDSTPARDHARKATALRSALARLMGDVPVSGFPLHPRTALIGETEKFQAYEVFLDVVPGLEVYGQLLIPRAALDRNGDRLPAMVCQHGFNGAPKYITGMGADLQSNDTYYHRFGERLAERGYVVFAPYTTVTDEINPIVQMAASLGMMRTGVELAKLHRVVDFLQSLPFVDPTRIGYYGMSYGGYAAAWMVPLEPRLRFTIISAYFNDLRLDLTDTAQPHRGFWGEPDEDPYTWNALNRFSHLELVAAMYPRPVCIEWGRSDPVTPPAWHERAWKEVGEYAAGWSLGDRIEDDHFLGGHTTHGMATFLFIDRWLRPEISAERDYGCHDLSYCNWTLSPDLRGYSEDSKTATPFVTQVLDASPESAVRGSFYVSERSPAFSGMAFKVSRVGTPGDLAARFGTRPGGADLGTATIFSSDVGVEGDSWQPAKLARPMKLDAARNYYFEIRAQSGHGPQNGYVVYGPVPLGGADVRSSFSLSFRVLTQ